MKTKLEICQNWLPRYLETRIDNLADYILLTNFHDYVTRFARRFDVAINGVRHPMPNATSTDLNITIINFGMGSPNAATIMDLLIARAPKAVLFLGKCGGLKKTSEIGHFILPIAAIRGEGTSSDYFPSAVPALPSFKLHKFVSEKIVEKNLEYRTGVVYTTNRRVWEHDDLFKERLRSLTCLAIDMETATIFIVGHYNGIPRGALLVVSDLPIMPDGIKTAQKDPLISAKWTDIHLDIGIESLCELELKGEQIKHFHY
jgi:AMP nucleosidase